MIKKFTAIALLVITNSVFATEPPKKAPMFGLSGQDCINGVCQVPQYSAPRVSRSTSYTFGMVPTVVAAPVVAAAPVQQTYQAVQVQKTRMVSKEIEVPVQKTVTVMEKRIVQEPQTYFEEVICPVQTSVCACPQNYVQVMSAQPVAQTRTRTVSRTRSWWFGKRIRAWRSGRGFFSSNRGTVYPPPGQDVYSHLLNDHGINAYGMSYQDALALHTSKH